MKSEASRAKVRGPALRDGEARRNSADSPWRLATAKRFGGAGSALAEPGAKHPTSSRSARLRRGRLAIVSRRSALAKASKVQWVRALISKFSNQSILVVGDLMLDRYVYGTVNRISPEAPVPVVSVVEEKNIPGGAANVARNVQALGGHAIVSGVVGQDLMGQDLLAVLAGEGVSTQGVIQLPGVRTTVKTRILAERQQVVRVDWEDHLNLSKDRWQTLCREITKIIRHVSGVIITDYAKGAIRQEVVDAVLSAAKQAAIPIALDPKPNTDLKVDGITVATPNRKEAFMLARVPERPPRENPLQDEALIKVADILLKQWHPTFLVITLGPQGMLLVSNDRVPQHIPTVAREVFDVSGAGDTVIATMLLALAAGANEEEAAELATCAAGVVVGKIGTAVCTSRELTGFYDLLIRTGKDAIHSRQRSGHR